MTSRSDEPRRDQSRRGSASGTDRKTGTPSGGRVDESTGRTPRAGGQPLGGIRDARAYTPRGRTVRETGRTGRDGADGYPAGRPGRTGDPFRPALQVLQGGREQAAARQAAARRASAAGTGGTTAARATTSRATTGRSANSRTTTGRTTVEPARPAAPRTGRPVAQRRSGRGTPAATPPARRPVRKPRRPPRLAEPSRRLRLGMLLALTLFATVGIRLITLQLVEAPAYADGGLADRLRTVTLPAPRGAIYDRSGAALAHSVEARFVYADPEMVDDPAAAATALSPLLGIPRSELTAAMVARKRPDGRASRFEWLARGIDIEQANKIVELNLAGIGVGRDERREVPNNDLAANLLGFTGTDLNGLEGLEARYDDVLRGTNGEWVFERGKGDLDAPIPGGYSQRTEARPGHSIRLTIDRDLQYVTQRALVKAIERAGGTVGAAVVLDVRTGEVLAQASEPTYDAARWQDSEPTARVDAATSFVVDPGSVHKAITFGAALEEGIVTPSSTLPVPSVVRKGEYDFTDSHDARGRRMTLAGMLAYSSNVGTIALGDALGPHRLYEYQQRFGLGSPTGVGLDGEAPGRLLPPEQWSGSSYGSVPIGHSVDATPLQMAAAYAAIANDGVWVQPRLVAETIAPDGSRTPAAAPLTRRVLSADNAAALRRMLEAVVAVPDATGVAAAIPGYRVAGKTGTGKQVLDGEYAPGEVASFIGMAPADAPRYVVAVFAYTPSGGGGDVAAPAFQEVMGFTLRHYRVPPTGAEPPNFTVYPQ